MDCPSSIEPDERVAAHAARFQAGSQTDAWEFLNVAQGGGVEEKDRDGEEKPRRSSEQKASPDCHGLLALRWRASLGEPHQHETGGHRDQEQAVFGRRLVGGRYRRLRGDEVESWREQNQHRRADLADVHTPPYHSAPWYGMTHFTLRGWRVGVNDRRGILGAAAVGELSGGSPCRPKPSRASIRTAR